MKVVQFVEGHNFHVDWHFKFCMEIGEKIGSEFYIGRFSCSPRHGDIQSLAAIYAKSVEKNTLEPL
jgi:hypothetical protein